MAASVWRFVAKPALEGRFEEFYGPDGDWAMLFRRSPNYQGTILLRDPGAPRAYSLIDVWDTREHCEEFRKRHAQQYLELDEECATLTDSETHVGWFETVEDVLEEL